MLGRSAAVGAWLLATALAGCLSLGVEPASPPGGGALVSAALRFDCPPGGAPAGAAGLCVRSFTSPLSAYEEPYLAVDPSDPRRMALGLNSWHAAPLPTAALGGPAGASEVGHLVLFVTEDAGATWREVPVPPPRFGRGDVGALRWTGDPSLEFDPRGVLHLTQLNLAFDGPFWFDVQYASTPDLGRTWSPPVLLAADGDADRNWLTVGPDGTLYATWRNQAGDGAGEATWSTDGGATWAEPLPAPLPCGHLGRALPTPAGVRLVCVLRGDAGPVGFRALALDPASRTLAPLADLPVPAGWSPGPATFPVGDARADGLVAHAVRQDAPDGFLVLSADAGRTWGAPVLLTDLCTCGEPARLLPHWVAFDRQGALHLVLGDRYPETPDRPNEDNVRYAAGDRSLWHVVLDPAGPTLLQEQRLTGPDPADHRVPPSLGPPVARDDYHTPAFWADGGALVWTRDRGIDLALLRTAPAD